MMTPYQLENAIDAGDYYEDDNYYAKDSPEALERTHWYGQGATALGLSGYVEKEKFVELLQGKLSKDIQLGRKREGKIDHRPGYDLTFGAPKSISILAEIGGDTNLHFAHNKAVNVALDFVEQYIAMTRVSEGNVTEFQQDVKCIFAKFRHDTARGVTDDTGEDTIDCHLHTHAVLLNALLCRDGVWRSLSSEKIYELKKTVGMIYRATLARLVVAYGYEITKTREDGLFEIKGITREQIEGFSKRTLLINDVKKQLKVQTFHGAKEVTTKTRNSKIEVDRALLHKEWVNRAAEMQIPYEVLIQNAKRNHDKFDHNDYDFEYSEALSSLQFAIAHLSETQSVFSRYDLILTTLAHGVGKFELDMAQHVINQAGEKRELIAVSPEKFTSPAVLQKEVEIIRRMKSGIGVLSPVTVTFINL